jgi:hypothetical protein
MFDLEEGMKLQFFRTVKTDGLVIPEGTRIRVESLAPGGAAESKVRVTMLGEPPESIAVPGHVLMLNCVPA